MHPPKAILFDADGTLYDSEQLQYESTRLAARDLHDFDFTEELYIKHMRHGSTMGNELLTELGLPTSEADYQAVKIKHFQRLVTERLQPMPGVSEFLRWCRERGIAMAVVSSSRRAQLQVALATIDITDFFDVIIGHEETEGRKKPDPYPYQLALELLHVSAAEAFVVEDTGKGIEAARAAGLRYVGIRNVTNTDTELAEADLIIDDYNQLCDAIDIS